MSKRSEKKLQGLQIGDNVYYRKIILLDKDEFLNGIIIHKDETEGVLLDTGDRISGVDKNGDYISLDFVVLDKL